MKVDHLTKIYVKLMKLKQERLIKPKWEIYPKELNLSQTERLNCSKTFSATITWATTLKKCQLHILLSFFVSSSFRKKGGNSYALRTLVGIRAGVHRQLTGLKTIVFLVLKILRNDFEVCAMILLIDYKINTVVTKTV